MKGSTLTCTTSCHLPLVLATGPGNLPAVRVRTGKTVWFGSRTVQKPDPQRLGRPNPDPYPSTRRFSQVWLDPSVPISSSVFRVFLFMVAFRYPTANRKILTLTGDCPFRMNRPPLSLKTRNASSMPHPEHDSHRRVHDVSSCFMSNLGGDWMQTIINEVLAVFQAKRDSNTCPAPF